MATPSGLVLLSADQALSPFTGWRRDHWEAVADHILETLQRYASPRHALPVLPGRVTSGGPRREGMEAIGRSFTLAAARIAGAEGKDPLGLVDWYAEALLAGTEPDGPEAWPLGVICRRPLTGLTNPIVEAANIAFSLHLTRPWLWDQLDRREQWQIAAWLLHHARLEVWQNNWQLFPAMAEAFLSSVGEDTSGCIGRRNVARVESWYLGDGWYTDGPEHAVDYYNAWTIHPYLWAWYRMKDDPSGADRHLERLAAFVTSYSNLFAPDGAVVHQGRSLTYRMGLLAPLWAAELSGVSPLDPGVTRRIASGALANFVRHGVGVDGPLTIGFYDEHLASSQEYSGFGSPYLAGIGFLGLALPAEHPVWTEVEGPQPTDQGDVLVTLPDVGWVVSGTADDGIVRLSNHGSDHCGLPVGNTPDPDDPHYAKFAYSTHTAPGTGTAWDDPVDGHLAMVAPDGTTSRRGPIRGSRVEGSVAGSAHVPQRDGRAFPGTSVVTVSILEGPYELRCHLVTAPASYAVREGGHAIAASTAPRAGADPAGAWAQADDGLVAAVLPLHGWTDTDVVHYPDGTALGRVSAAPFLRSARAAEQTVHVALHVLTRGEPDVLRWSTAVQLHLAGTTVRATWRTGPVHEVDLAQFVPWDGLPG